MKKLMSMIVMCLCTLMGMQAQTIKSGSKWWDGMVLYTATVDESGVVKMHGVWAHPGHFLFQLSPVEGGAHPYCLSADAPDAGLPVRGELGGDVDYIRQEGMNFLAIRKPNGDICHTLVLTPDNIENCTAQEKYAEAQPVGDIITSMLLNTTYLGRFTKPQLRLMRNEILARHGWRFQSQDLKDHFAAQPWYRPVADNNSIKLSVIEQANLQLIKSEEAVPEKDRIDASRFDSLPLVTDAKPGDFPGGLDDDGRGPDEVDGEEVYIVENEDQFFDNLRPGRIVYIPDNVHLNLSRYLEDDSHFKKRPGRRWSEDATAIIAKEPLVVSEGVFDGRQLTLVNFSDLIIKGGKNASIEVDPRYAFCFNLVNCDHVQLLNLTIGHTEGGSCSGGVIGVKGGRQNQANDCDLYGCGTYGLDLDGTTDFSLMNTNIHDCTYGIMQLRSSMAIRFNKCDFFNNREFSLIEGVGVEGLSFIDCRFFANHGDAPLFSLDNEFYMSGCEIYHPTENLGTIDMADQSGPKNFFSENPLDTNIKPRGIGPK